MEQISKDPEAILEKLEAIGVNTEEGIARSMGNRDFYLKMLLVYAKGDQSFDRLCEVLDSNDPDQIFEACAASRLPPMNLAITPVAEPLWKLFETTRHRVLPSEIDKAEILAGGIVLKQLRRIFDVKTRNDSIDEFLAARNSVSEEDRKEIEEIWQSGYDQAASEIKEAISGLRAKIREIRRESYEIKELRAKSEQDTATIETLFAQKETAYEDGLRDGRGQTWHDGYAAGLAAGRAEHRPVEDNQTI